MGCLGNATTYSSHFYIMAKFIDLTGKRFEKLLVIERLPNTEKGRAVWFCMCDCGNMKKVSSRNLKQGYVRSCGCLFNIGGTTHGLSTSKCPEYEAWRSMKRRCAENNKKSYNDYFARGIKVCDEWYNDFMAFYKYMGKRPSDNHSLDRIDNNGNYEVGNVRWATTKTQSRNKRANISFMYNEENTILKDMATELCISAGSIMFHLKKGRTIEQIVAHYKYKKDNNLTYLKWR